MVNALLLAGVVFLAARPGPAWGGPAEETELPPEVQQGQARFGQSVCMSTDLTIVGAPYYDVTAGGTRWTDAGVAYVFRKIGGSWVQEGLGQAVDPKLIAHDRQREDYFGYSVSINENWAAAGAYGQGEAGYDSGAVYLFEYEGGIWNRGPKLNGCFEVDGTEYHAQPSDIFGISVSMTDNVMIVGARRDDPSANDSWRRCGSATVFRYNGATWDAEAKLAPGDGNANDSFGYSVSISADPRGGYVAVVGAPHVDVCDPENAGCNSGAAYVFRGEYDSGSWNWVPEGDRLTAADDPDRKCGQQFGWSVSVSGDVCVVGAWKMGGEEGLDLLLDQGMAYVFRYVDGTTPWTQEGDRLSAEGDAAELDYFGYSVAVSDGCVVVGAPGDVFSDPLTSPGWGYVFQYDGSANWPRVPGDSGRFTAAGAVYGDEFGLSVSITGGVGIFGAPHEDLNDQTHSSGAAYVIAPLCGCVVDAKLSVTPNPASVGEPIRFTVTNKGAKTIQLAGWPWVRIKNSDGVGVFPDVVGTLATFVPPGGSETYVWNQQTDINGAQVEPGVYTVEVPYVVGAPRYLLSGEFVILEPLGACCNVSVGACMGDLPQTECLGLNGQWFEGMRCNEIECPGAIPTVSKWGLVIMGLLLLTGLKIRFGGRQLAQA